MKTAKDINSNGGIIFNIKTLSHCGKINVIIEKLSTFLLNT